MNIRIIFNYVCVTPFHLLEKSLCGGAKNCGFKYFLFGRITVRKVIVFYCIVAFTLSSWFIMASSRVWFTSNPSPSDTLVPYSSLHL